MHEILELRYFFRCFQSQFVILEIRGLRLQMAMLEKSWNSGADFRNKITV